MQTGPLLLRASRGIRCTRSRNSTRAHLGSVQRQECSTGSFLLAQNFASLAESPSSKDAVMVQKGGITASSTNTVWTESTLQLLEKVPFGSMQECDWEEARCASHYWAGLHTSEGVSWCWRILDRLVDEKKHQQHMKQSIEIDEGDQYLPHLTESTLPTGWLHRIIDAWAQCPPGDNEVDPYQIMAKFEMYAPFVIPNLYIYHMLIATFSKRDNPRKAPHLADTILQRLWKESEIHPQLCPNAGFYECVLNAWAQSGHPDAPSRTETLVKEMMHHHDSGIDDMAPTNRCYTAIILAYARIGAARQAEEWLQRMYDLSSVHPDVISFTVVLNAWAKSHEKSAAFRAEQILSRMQELYVKGVEDVKPNNVSFNTVLNCWAKSNWPGAAEHAEALLQQMEKLSHAGDTDMKPTVISCTTVLKAWSNSRREDAPERAEALLRMMCQGQWEDVTPNVMSFNTTLNCWATSTRHDAVERAEALLQRMQRLYDAGDCNVRPDTVSCNTVLCAWSRSRRDDAPKRAEALLQQMCEGRWVDVKPNMISFSTVLHCWARSACHGAAENAEALLQWMQQQHDTRVEVVKPNAISCSTISSAPSRSQWEDAPEQAEALLQLMCDPPRVDVKPNMMPFTTILNSGGKTTPPGATDCTAALRQRMKAIYHADVKPDLSICNSVLNAWSKNPRVDAPERAEAFLQQMYEGRWVGVKPDMKSFTHVLNCWARSARHGAVEPAEALFQRMQDLNDAGDKNGKPNVISCNIILNAWSRSQRDDAPEQAEALLQLMCEGQWVGIKPDVISYSAVLNSWTKSSWPGAAERADALRQRMQEITLQR